MSYPCDECQLELSHCPLYPNACGKIKDYQRAIAARDKWWLSKVPNQAGQCHLHMCEYIDDKCNRRFACADCSWWQSLKREVGQ